jgi:hypothetical protein
MDRISTATKAPDLFGAGKHGWKDGNVAGGIVPTDFNAAWCNGIQEELLAIIESAGLVPSAATFNQVKQAIDIMVRRQAGAVCVGAGTADALTGAYTPVVSTLVDGMYVSVRAGAANATTTPTFKADGMAIKTVVKGNNLPLAVGDIAGAGHWIELQYDLTLDKWVLLNPASAVRGAVGIGCVIDCFSASIPAGYLLCPTVLTNISRVTYAALFAEIGTTFGVGDGATTYGMPWYPADYASVQASGNAGSQTVGQVIAHQHAGVLVGLAGNNGGTGPGTTEIPIAGNTASTGGSGNLPAGVRAKKIVRYI